MLISYSVHFLIIHIIHIDILTCACFYRMPRFKRVLAKAFSPLRAGGVAETRTSEVAQKNDIFQGTSASTSSRHQELMKHVHPELRKNHDVPRDEVI